MPERKPRTKAPKGEQLGKVLQGELALYESLAERFPKKPIV
jgi:hypothetical protein